MEKLKTYHQKRNFAKTREPQGEVSQPDEKLRFVVQHHLARRDHFDFRLEWEDVLLSWAVPKGPSYNARDKRLAIRVEDHPLEYRHFEGTIPKGEYGGGVVQLWDEGFWEPDGEVAEGLKGGVLKFELKGRRLKGKWALIRLKAKAAETKDSWLLLKEKDAYAKTSDGISDFTTSVRTGRTLAEIEKGEDEKFTKNPFHTVDVQLAKLVRQVPEGGEWLYELKYDGYRIIAFVEGRRVRLISRNGHDYTDRFRFVAASLADWSAGRAMVLDGEMVVTDEKGKTDFQALQNYLRNQKGQNLAYIVFDLLALDGEDLRNHRLIERKAVLETLMKDAPKNLRFSRHVRGNGEDSFTAACDLGMEGIVGKKADSLYSGSRNGGWIKLKCDKRQDFVIGGYTVSDKNTRGISSLLLGVYEGEDLVYAGRAGTGLSSSDMKRLELKFEKIKRLDSPFKNTIKQKTNEKIIWLEPRLVAEIKFAEWTKEGLLRQTSFKGLCTDKAPEAVRREKAEDRIQLSPPDKDVASSTDKSEKKLIVEGVKITNQDKVMFPEPEITKKEVIRYYEQAAAYMLPYISQRLLSVVRCPRGINETCFYKKHPGPGSKEVTTFILNTEREKEEYFYIDNTSGLIAEAQMGTLEFHIWASRIETLEQPDMMVFDLDPDEGMDLNRVRRGVIDVKSILEELSLKCYLKTSGGKGYHVVVPFTPSVSWDAFYNFAKRVAEVMEHQWPERYTSNVRKAARKNKIFIDWIRNGRGATSIAPYSIRARKGAAVSMPIAWDELDMIAPDEVTMTNALRRLDGHDPWKDFFREDQRLR